LLIKEFISKERDYSVPCLYNINGHEKIVCIIVHGFGSSKTSVTAKMMLEELPPLGIGAIAFDLPAHGDSGVDGEFLRLDNCLMDLADVEAFAHILAPEAEIVYFASSFGAYVTLIYLAGGKQIGRRAFLRSAAVSMPRIINQEITPEQKLCLETKGEVLLDKEKYGHARQLKITQMFLDDLKHHDVFSLWHDSFAELCMIHGESDQTTPLSDTQAFSKMFHVPLILIPDGDHQLSVSGAPEKVLKQAAKFFLGLQ
jgi:pimeloyl-ACP methyl ester carboxylesterase